MQQRRALHQVAQLAHVPGQGCATSHRRASSVSRLGAKRCASAYAEEPLGKDRRRPRVLAERRQRQHDHGETMVEVAAELSRRHERGQIPLRRRDQLHVDLPRLDRAEAPDRLLLDRLQELALTAGGERVDLVEKERPAGGRLEEAALRSLGIGEGASLEAEELGLEHRLGNGGAVHVDEGRARASAAVVQHARDQAFAGPGLAGQQHGRRVRVAGEVEGCEALDLGPQPGHRLPVAQYPVRWIRCHRSAI